MRSVLLMGLLAVLLSAGGAHAGSNKDRVRSLLQTDAWTVRWMPEFAENKAASFNRLVAQSRSCLEKHGRNARRIDDCLDALKPYFDDRIKMTAVEIARRPEARGLRPGKISAAILQSLQTSRTVRLGAISVHAGLAIYSNWRSVVHRVPVQRYRWQKVGPVKTKVPYMAYEDREQRVELPKTYQPFIRFKSNR